MKFGIIADTHITYNSNKGMVSSLISQLKHCFNDIDEIIHAGDICEDFFLKELETIAPIKCVKGNLDKIENLETFIKFRVSRYNIGIIHILPKNLEEFAKKYDIHILIYGHTHQPLIKGTNFNVLLINPGSPVKPKAPPPKPGFFKPVARRTVITLNIDDNDVLSTFIINLKSAKFS